MKKIIVATLFSLPMFANAASFDCTKASTTIETTICSDATLSKLDEQLDVAYKAAVKVKPIVREQQRGWIKNSRNTADSVERLQAMMETRLVELRSDATPQPMQRQTQPMQRVEEPAPRISSPDVKTDAEMNEKYY